MDEIASPRAAPTAWLQAVEAGRADLASGSARVSAEEVLARLSKREARLRAEGEDDVRNEMNASSLRF